MKEYRVSLNCNWEIVVEAKDRDEAINIAFEQCPCEEILDVNWTDEE